MSRILSSWRSMRLRAARPSARWKACRTSDRAGQPVGRTLPCRALTLYTKPDCPLCDEAAEALERVRGRAPFDLEVVDISTDPELRERYGERIPVVLVDGRAAFEYVVDEARLEQRLSAAGAPS